MALQTLSVSEVAEYLGVSKDVVYTLVRKKQIPNFRMGRRVLFRLDSIEKWIKKQEEQNSHIQIS